MLTFALPQTVSVLAARRHGQIGPRADIRFRSEMKEAANEGGSLFLKASDGVECLVSAEACRRECQSGEFPALWQRGRPS
jgi:hypothetical protein